MTITRRSLLAGILASAAAPAIVRASSLMPLWVPGRDALFAGGTVHLFTGDTLRVTVGGQVWDYVARGPGSVAGVQLRGERQIVGLIWKT